MLSLPTETHVPTYSLQQTSRTGSSDFEIVYNTGLTQQQKDLFFVPHRKDFYLFILVKQGGSRHWVDMVPYTVKPGTFYFSNPQQVYLKEDGTFEAIAICFTQEFLDMEEHGLLNQLPILQNGQSAHELTLSPADISFIEELSTNMIAEFSQKEGWRNGMLSAYLRVLLIYLSRLYTAQYPANNQSADRELLGRFQSLVSDYFTEYHDVAAYADMLHLSSGHFSELIKKQSGKTPIEHIHDRLLLEAKRLLFHTDASIKEIAFQLGFEEASYFNRFFKRLSASTPLAYRSQIREKYH